MAEQSDIVQFLVGKLRSRRAGYRRANGHAVLASLRNGARIIHVNIFEFERLDDQVEVRDHERRFRDLENISSEPRDLLLNVYVRALHDGHHGDQRGDAHGETDHSEHRAQLVLAQGVDALAQVVGEVENFTVRCVSTSFLRE